MATSQIKSFKISQLPAITQSSISDNDLFLVSDYNGGKCDSKKMLVGEYAKYIQTKLKPVIQQIVNDAISEAIEHEVSGIAHDVLQQELPDALSTALSSYDFDPIVATSLDRISDGKLDDIVLVNGGNSNGGGPIYEE